VLSIWAAALKNVFGTLQEPYFGIVQLLPLYALITFGCWSLGIISYNLITFQECPEEAKELEIQRKQAMTELSKKGISFSKTAKAST